MQSKICSSAIVYDYKSFKLITIIILIFYCFPQLNASASKETTEKEPEWSVFAYGGKWSENRILEIMQGSTELRESYIWAAGLSRNLHRLGQALLLEGEINTALHSGKQNHWEVNSALILRFASFPWGRYIDTSIAYGLGLSYAFQHPEVEKKGPEKGVSRSHLFMPVEITVAPPSQPISRRELLFRIHHRSGAYGLFRDAHGSNFVVTGIRYRF